MSTPSVLITGTSKGIGFEAALAFARAGYRVHATMRNPDASPALAQLAAAENLPIHITAMDVDNDSSVAQGIAAIEAQHGPIDVLVNNAGIEVSGSVEETSLDRFRAVMETNYFGVVRCLQAVVRHMRERRSGTIINISSVAGVLTNPPCAAYSASKWALEALTEAFAAEVKPFNIRVALVEPGIVDTSMAQRLAQSGDSAYPHAARFAMMFTQTLANNPTTPSIIASKILEVAQSSSWQLRHPASPDAHHLIGWRKSMTDEQWIDLNAADDATFFRALTGGPQ